MMCPYLGGKPEVYRLGLEAVEDNGETTRKKLTQRQEKIDYKELFIILEEGALRE